MATWRAELSPVNADLQSFANASVLFESVFIGAILLISYGILGLATSAFESPPAFSIHA